MTEPVHRGDFSRRGVAMTSDLRHLIDRFQERWADVTDTFADFRDALAEFRDHALTITVVDTLADLPDEAKPTEWFRVVATPAAVYVGNGPGRPLSKFQTTAI